MSVLFIGPGGDEVSEILSDIAKQVIARTTVHPDRPIGALWGVDATRSAIDRELADNPHVMYFGHGYLEALNDPPLIDRRNIGMAAGRIVLAMCCSSAGQFGEEAVKLHGVSAYLGFTRPIFIPMLEGAWSSSPWTVAGTLLGTGSTTGEAEDGMKRALQSEGDRIYHNQLGDYASAVNDMLVHYGMAHAFICLGDPGVLIR
jgi:hypothetical protein